MRKEVITIRQVAERAGVSPSTVSHVINGNAGHAGEATREKVFAAIKQLNYRPNAIARSMVTNSTSTIGLVITELQNPLFSPVTEGVEEILRARGYHIILAGANNVASEERAIETLRSKQVDGFIFMSLSLLYPSDHLVRLKEERIPLVVINRYLEDREINQVQLDDCGAGKTATQHLIQLGHTRIGVISGPIQNTIPRRSALERQEGWYQAMQAAGLNTPPEWLVVSDYTFESGYRAAQTLMLQCREKGSPLPSALFIANESMAMGAIKAFNEAGLALPGDLAIVSVGDPPFAAYIYPALTTLSLPVVEAGRVAARILLDWLKAERPPRPQSVTLGCTLKIRESCGATLSRANRPEAEPLKLR